MTRIRLLFVLSSPVRAGVEEVVLALLQRLDRTVFELGLAAPGPLLDSLRPDLHGLPVSTHEAGAQSWLDRREVSDLARAIRAFRPAIVNSHLFRTTLVAAPLAKWLGVPRVVETYHGREAWRVGGIRGSFLPDRIVSHWVDRVIAVSQAARSFLVDVKRIPAAKVVVVPNGRDLSHFVPGQAGEAVRKELGLDPAAPVIGAVGRLEPQKGPGYLLEALPPVVAEFPDVRLVMVGDGSLRGQLEAQARRLGVAGHVLFTGFRSDVPRCLDAMDLVVLPSLHEGMPLTAIEAGALAKPMVATSVDGTPEVVADGVTGRLVPPADPRALTAAMLAMLRAPAQARTMGEAARVRVLERFDLDRHVQATARVYREMIGP